MTTRLQKNVKQYFKDNIGIIGALLILCIFLSVFPKTSGSFLTQKNIFNVLRQISSNLFLACGMTMVIILGGIDLSVGSIIALSGCFAAGCVSRYGLPIAVGVLGGVLVGTVVGMINGVVISKTTIPPFIVTLATMNVAKGLAYVYTGGSPVRVVTKEWQFLGAGYVGGVPTPVILLAVVLVITAIIMNKTKLGRHIYAVGGNSQAARFSGISTAKVKFLVHTYSGIMAGLAGVVLASRMYSGQPTAGDGAGRHGGRCGGRYLHGRRLRQNRRHHHRRPDYRRAEQRPESAECQFLLAVRCKGNRYSPGCFCGLPKKQKGGIKPGLRQKRFTAVGRFLSKSKFCKKFL